MPSSCCPTSQRSVSDDNLSDCDWIEVDVYPQSPARVPTSPCEPLSFSDRKGTGNKQCFGNHMAQEPETSHVLVHHMAQKLRTSHVSVHLMAQELGTGHFGSLKFGTGIGNRPCWVEHMAQELGTGHVGSIIWHMKWEQAMLGWSHSMGIGNRPCWVPHMAQNWEQAMLGQSHGTELNDHTGTVDAVL